MHKFPDDLWAGEQFYSSQYNLIPGTTWTEVVGTNPDRVALLLSSGDAGTVFYSTEKVGTNTGGFPIGQNIGFMLLSADIMGNAVKKAWYAFSAAGNQNVTIIEVSVRRGDFK